MSLVAWLCSAILVVSRFVDLRWCRGGLGFRGCLTVWSLVESPEGVVPVEMKSRGIPRGGPYWNHLVQLVVYLLLVEEYYGSVSYGVIKYSDQSVKVLFTPDLRKRVLGLVSEIRWLRKFEVEAVKRSHEMAGRCAGCGFVPLCSEAISR